MVLVNHGAGGHAELLHYPLWIEQAVPLFLLIQVFHANKRDMLVYPEPSKIWHRIQKPFLLIQLVFILYHFLRCTVKDESILYSLTHMLYNGGSGPGSYYIWIYIQIAILCPLMYRWVKSKFAFLIFGALCIMLEIFCSVANMPENVYRLLCFRYVFLIYLGYLWVKNDGIVLNKKTILLSLISAMAIVMLNITHNHFPCMNFEPWVFDTNWTAFHWFTYFLPWSLEAFVICKFYLWKPDCKINRLVLLCGKRSYEIFLWQMLVFGVSPLNGKINILLSLLPLLLYEGKRVKEIMMKD